METWTQRQMLHNAVEEKCKQIIQLQVQNQTGTCIVVLWVSTPNTLVDGYLPEVQPHM